MYPNSVLTGQTGRSLCAGKQLNLLIHCDRTATCGRKTDTSYSIYTASIVSCDPLVVVEKCFYSRW